MTALETFLRTYGLWALFFAAATEGDLALLLTGMLIHLGIWQAARAMPVGAMGGLAGDVFYFWLGHGTARRWLITGHGKRVMPRIERAAQRYGIGSLFIARYVYGARIVTMFFWGTRRLSYQRFLVLDALNCSIWACVLAGIGYLFSSSLEWLIGELRIVELWLLAGLLTFAILLALRYWLAETKRVRETNGKQGPDPG